MVLYPPSDDEDSCAEGILRVLTCIKNNELEYWLSSEFAGGQLDIGDQEELKFLFKKMFQPAQCVL